MTEEATFRKLRQRPISEFYNLLYVNDDLSFSNWLKRKQTILEENGWTLFEFNRAVVKERVSNIKDERD